MQKKILKNRPMIAEALCELHFSVKSSQEKDPYWDPRWFGKILQQLGSKYDLEPAQGKMMRIHTEPGQKMSISEVHTPLPENRMIYKHHDKSHLFQLSPQILTVNIINDYPGWETFLQYINTGWENLSKLGHIEVNRVGLRYINRIPRSENSKNVEHWLLNEDWLPQELRKQSENFIFKFEREVNSNLFLKINLSEEFSETSPSPILFDLDAISFKKSLSDWVQINSEIKRLHDIIRDKFDSSLSKNYYNSISPNNEEKK